MLMERCPRVLKRVYVCVLVCHKMTELLDCSLVVLVEDTGGKLSLRAGTDVRSAAAVALIASSAEETLTVCLNFFLLSLCVCVITSYFLI